MRAAVLACGALAADVRLTARRRGWKVDVMPVPALLHNRPEQIAPAVAASLRSLSDSYDVVAVAYGDWWHVRRARRSPRAGGRRAAGRRSLL